MVWWGNIPWRKVNSLHFDYYYFSLETVYMCLHWFPRFICKFFRNLHPFQKSSKEASSTAAVKNTPEERNTTSTLTRPSVNTNRVDQGEETRLWHVIMRFSDADGVKTLLDMAELGIVTRTKSELTSCWYWTAGWPVIMLSLRTGLRLLSPPLGNCWVKRVLCSN